MPTLWQTFLNYRKVPEDVAAAAEQGATLATATGEPSKGQFAPPSTPEVSMRSKNPPSDAPTSVEGEPEGNRDQGFAKALSKAAAEGHRATEGKNLRSLSGEGRFRIKDLADLPSRSWPLPRPSLGSDGTAGEFQLPRLRVNDRLTTTVRRDGQRVVVEGAVMRPVAAFRYRCSFGLTEKRMTTQPSKPPRYSSYRCW